YGSGRTLRARPAAVVGDRGHPHPRAGDHAAAVLGDPARGDPGQPGRQVQDVPADGRDRALPAAADRLAGHRGGLGDGRGADPHRGHRRRLRRPGAGAAPGRQDAVVIAPGTPPADGSGALPADGSAATPAATPATPAATSATSATSAPPVAPPLAPPVAPPATPTQVLDALVAAGATVAVAESLTGGLLTAALTEPAGASNAVRGGVVVYATDLKATLAGVPVPLLDAEGPVSPDVAGALAAGARDRLGA